MKKSVLFLFTAFITLSFIFLSAPKAKAETTDYCTEISPSDPKSTLTLISNPGVYCLTKDFEYTGTGNAIQINADDVVLDLNGHTISGPAVATTPDLSTTTQGIYANGMKNVTIKNGTIRGFKIGIFLEHTSGSRHLIEDILADTNTMRGIQLQGSGSTVRNNRVINTGGTTYSYPIVGINLAGAENVRVLNNDISNTFSSGSLTSTGLVCQSSDGCILKGNRISKTSSVSADAYGLNINSSSPDTLIAGNFVRETTSTNNTAYGIRVNSNYVDIIDNRVSKAYYGVYSTSTTEVRCRDNIASNVTTPYTDCDWVGDLTNGNND